MFVLHHWDSSCCSNVISLSHSILQRAIQSQHRSQYCHAFDKVIAGVPVFSRWCDTEKIWTAVFVIRGGRLNQLLVHRCKTRTCSSKFIQHTHPRNRLQNTGNPPRRLYHPHHFNHTTPSVKSHSLLRLLASSHYGCKIKLISDLSVLSPASLVDYRCCMVVVDWATDTALQVY